MDQKYKVVIADGQTESQLENWKTIGEQMGFAVDVRTEMDQPALEKAISDAEVIVTQKVLLDRDLISKAQQLKLIQKMGGRADNIDVKAANERGIEVSTLSLPGSVAVAEHAMMLILACAKKVIQGHNLTKNGSYRELGIEPKLTTQRSHGFQWMKIPDLQELDGMTLGIFGFGDIGNEIAKRARSFNMRIIYHKRHPLDAEMEKELGVEYVTKAELFKQADFLVMISPLTPETEKAAGVEEFRLMKPSAYFINCCRGGVMDEDALYHALKDGQIAGAGLDVFTYEPVPFDNPLLSLDNVTLTPHIAGGKGGAAVRQVQAVFENIQKCLQK